jgi:hypothetical protein
MQNFNMKYLIIFIRCSEHCTLLKYQNLSDFVILWSLEYKEFGIETLHICTPQHCPHLELILIFLKTLD